MLLGDRGTWVQTTCPEDKDSERTCWELKLVTCRSQMQCPNVQPPSHNVGWKNIKKTTSRKSQCQMLLNEKMHWLPCRIPVFLITDKMPITIKHNVLNGICVRSYKNFKNNILYCCTVYISSPVDSQAGGFAKCCETKTEQNRVVQSDFLKPKPNWLSVFTCNST